jgi:hypothetical protein
MVAKVDQNEKVTTLKCDTDPTVGPPTAGTSVPITLKQCEIGVKVKVEPAKQTEWTLSCDPGVPEATYVLDEQANTVTYRNPKIPLEQTVAKKCPQKKCDPRESSLIYCETWKAQFDKHVVDWIRCDTDAGTPGSNDDQKDEVTLDLQTGLMRQRFIGKAVQGMADRTWKCKVVKPKLITAQNAKDGPTVETSTTKKDGEVTTTIKVTTKKDSPADQ